MGGQYHHELMKYCPPSYVLCVSSHFWPFTIVKFVLEKLDKNLGSADPPPQLGRNPKFFQKLDLKAPLIQRPQGRFGEWVLCAFPQKVRILYHIQCHTCFPTKSNNTLTHTIKYNGVCFDKDGKKTAAGESLPHYMASYDNEDNESKTGPRRRQMTVFFLQMFVVIWGGN